MIGKKCLLLMFMLLLYLAALTALISLSEAENEEPTIEEVDTFISEAKDLIEKVKELAPGDDGAIEKAVETVEKAQREKSRRELGDALELAKDAVEELKKVLLSINK